MKRYFYAGAGVLAALILAFLGGRFTSPTKTVEKTAVRVEVVRDEVAIAKAVAEARAQWAKDVQDHTVTRTLYREGKIVEKVVFVDRETKSSGSSESAASTDTKVATHEATEKTEEHEKVMESARPRLALGASLPPRYPVSLKAVAPEADVRIWGTIWLGARYVHTDATPLRVAVRIEF